MLTSHRHKPPRKKWNKTKILLSVSLLASGHEIPRPKFFTILSSLEKEVPTILQQHDLLFVKLKLTKIFVNDYNGDLLVNA